MSPHVNVSSKELAAIKAMRKGIVRTAEGYPAAVRPDGRMTNEVDPEFAEECLTGLGTWGPLRVDPAMREVYNPPERKRLPKKGAWVLVTRALPPMEKGMDRKIRVGRVFYAVHDAGTDEFGFGSKGTYKVVVTTPWGHVHLWPYEYDTIEPKTLLELWDAKELLFHPIQNPNQRWSDAVFYLRSRGIGLTDAVVMALGTLDRPVGWFEPRPDLARACEAMEARVHRWKPRKAHPFRVELRIERASWRSIEEES